MFLKPSHGEIHVPHSQSPQALVRRQGQDPWPLRRRWRPVPRREARPSQVLGVHLSPRRGQLAGTTPANRVLSPCINKLTVRVNVFKDPTANLPAVGGHYVVIPNIGVGLGRGTVR